VAPPRRGFQNLGESIADTAQRELREESGLSMETGPLKEESIVALPQSLALCCRQKCKDLFAFDGRTTVR